MKPPIIKKTKNKGRAVFAQKAYKKGDVVLCDPCVIIPDNECKNLEKTILGSYYFGKDISFVVLGIGSLLSHAHEPNTRWKFLSKSRLCKFIALRAIKPGEELTIHYGWDSFPWEE